jgi:hypothetical protein
MPQPGSQPRTDEPAKPPLAARYNENRAFWPQKATVIGKNRSLFQPLARKIRYLADQWKINGIFRGSTNFACANNRISMEVVQVVKTGKSGQLSALDAPPAIAHRDGGNRSRPNPVRGTRTEIAGLKALGPIRELPMD